MTPFFFDYNGREGLYVWMRVSKLTEDLREGRVDQKEQFKYYLQLSRVERNCSGNSSTLGALFPIRRLIPVGLNLAVTIKGVVYCYAINNMGVIKILY